MLLPIEYHKLKHDDCLFVDVRSPSEFSEATIEGAVNLALFSDEQRQIIGTLYKHDSPFFAKQKGVEMVSKKLPLLFEKIVALKRSSGKRLVLFCARGGMRSTSLALFLNGLGENVYYLKDGYRGYRRHIISELPKISEKIIYVVLHGRTGVGKTMLLKHLSNLGNDVLDLEEAACHRGSLLGGIGLSNQPSTKTFESRLYHILKSRKSNFVFVEAESQRIGKVFVPKVIKSDMAKGLQILVDASLDFRAKLLTCEYTAHGNENPALQKALDKMRRYMGNEPVDKLLNSLDNEDYDTVAKTLMRTYYDPMYDHSIGKQTFDFSVFVKDFSKTALTLSNWLEEKKPSMLLL